MRRSSSIAIKIFSLPRSSAWKLGHQLGRKIAVDLFSVRRTGEVQTSLNVPFFNMDMLLDIVDVWHIDIKDMNQEIYEAYTGCSNEIVIKNSNVYKGVLLINDREG